MPTPTPEETALWDTFEAELKPKGLKKDPTLEGGATAKWLRDNLLIEVPKPTWPGYEPEVTKCATLAGKCAAALQDVFSPGSPTVQEDVFWAAVWTVKMYQEHKTSRSGLKIMSVICAP